MSAPPQVKGRCPVRVLSVVFLAAGLVLSAGAAAVSADARDDLTDLARDLARDVRGLSSLPEGSRVTGYPGADAARDYIVRRLGDVGAERITVQEFPVVVPVTKAVSVRVGGRDVPAYPLWPNGVRTCTTDGTVTGPVISAGRSSFSDYNGKQVEGSIVLLDGDRSVDWVNAPGFGARAVLFIEPEECIRRELEYKVSDIPLATPRFWIPREAGLRLRQRVEDAEAQGTPLQAEVSCVVDWEKQSGWNVLALLPGSDPTQREHLTVLQTYYDAISVVPDLAPGAESAGNAAALLSVAQALKDDPPRRPVLLVFTAGHFESLAGIRWFCDLLALNAEALESEITRLRTNVIKEEERLADYAAIRELFTVIRDTSPEAYQRAMEAVARMEEEVLTARHQRDKYAELYEVLHTFNTEPFYVSTKTALDRYESKDRSTESGRLKYLRLVGHRAVLEQIDPNLAERITFTFSLDLSSRSADLGLFHKGNFVDQGGIHSEGVIRRVFNKFGERAGDLAREALGEGVVIDGINQPTGRVWRTYFPAPVAFESELLTVSAMPAVTFATANDARDLVDTPVDVPERVHMRNLAVQVAAIRRLLLGAEVDERTSTSSSKTGSAKEGRQSRGLLNDLLTKLAIDGIKEDSLLTRWATRVVGRVVEYDPRRSLGVADVPVPECVVTCRQNPGPYSRGDVWKSYCGVRPLLLDVSDGAGNFEFLTVPHQRSLPWDHRKFLFEAYHLDPTTGAIDFAPDHGDQGATLFPIDIPLSVAEKDITIVVFECTPVAVFDLLDQRSYNMFSTVTLYDARTDSAPFSFGYKVAGLITGTSYIEPVGVLFLSPGIRFKATFGAGVAGTKFALIGATAPDKAHYNGVGYRVAGRQPSRTGARTEEPSADGGQAGVTSLINTPYLMARDIWNLDEYRLNVLRTHGVTNQKVEGLHRQARAELTKAAQALEELRYGAFVRHARAAWGYEARAYPSVEGTTTDITTGVLFFLFLLLPVSHFAERLIFGFPDINRQILGFFGIFLVMFLVLALVHPAFGVTSGGPIILLAFITVALSVLVISMIRSRFEVELERLQQRPGQTARADLNRANAAKQAFLLGIANMRRRKIRTSLTIVTLAALMFTVLSLTSIEPKLVVKRRGLADNVPLPYEGVLIRDVAWGTLTDQVYKGMLNQFVGGIDEDLGVARAPEAGESGAIVAPRAWYVSESMKVPTAVEVSSTADPDRRFIATALVGLSPLERFVTRPQDKLVTPPAWFAAGERECCVLTQKMAAVLGISREEVTGEVPTAPRIKVFGQELAVIGIFDDDTILHATDIDDEVLSPVDYQEESWQKHWQMRRDPTEVYHYVHLDPRNVLWVTYDFLMSQGGTLRSLVYLPADPTVLEEQVEDDLLRRHTISAFVSMAEEREEGDERREADRSSAARPETGLVGRILFATSVGEMAISGVGSLLVPLSIAALIVLNTMLGAVYERTREIWIYGSLGLSPTHIGALFMAESCVFASVSTVIGYLVGQVAARFITQQGLLSGLSLNYSSYSAIYSAAFTMGVVLLSTIYPARKAAQMSVPDIERIWKFPEPEGDRLVFDFPFTMGSEQALGVSIHLLHYFEDHDSQSVGDFFTADNRLWAEPEEEGLAYHLASTTWIAPFDFGISQRLHMVTIPSVDPGIFLARMTVERLSGAPAAWVRMNHRFLKLIRKQFLIWRLFSPAERAHYITEAKRMLGLPVEDVESGSPEGDATAGPEQDAVHPGTAGTNVTDDDD